MLLTHLELGNPAGFIARKLLNRHLPFHRFAGRSSLRRRTPSEHNSGVWQKLISERQPQSIASWRIGKRQRADVGLLLPAYLERLTSLGKDV